MTVYYHARSGADRPASTSDPLRGGGRLQDVSS